MMVGRVGSVVELLAQQAGGPEFHSLHHREKKKVACRWHTGLPGACLPWQLEQEHARARAAKFSVLVQEH